MFLFQTSFSFVAERTLKFLEPIPDDFLSAYHALSARKCDWSKHFSRDRVKQALRLLHGVSYPSSLESSDHRTQFFVDMQSTKLSLREVYAKKKEDKERRLAEDKRLGTEFFFDLRERFSNARGAVGLDLHISRWFPMTAP